MARSADVEIHAPEDPRVDRIPELTREAASARPLPVVLQRLCERVAGAIPADVASFYVRERVEQAARGTATSTEGGEDMLVMRANVGFVRGAGCTKESCGKLSGRPRLRPRMRRIRERRARALQSRA